MRYSRGNIFTILLGGIVLSGVLSVSLYQLMGGSVFSTIRLAKKTGTDAQLQNAARVLISRAGNQSPSATTSVPGDCDADGFVEPPAFRAAAGWGISEPDIHPDNGGLIPLDAGTGVTDAWGTDFGYCVWDVGAQNDPLTDNGCGAPVRRLAGTDKPASGTNQSQTVMALISAGPDKRFQTTCHDYAGPATNLVTTVSGADDIVTRFSYAEASLATAALWNLKTGTPSRATTSNSMLVGAPGALKALTASSPVASLSVSTTGKVVAGTGTVLGRETTVADAMCDSAHVGLLRYNTTVNAGIGGIQYCTSSGWSTVSIPGGPSMPNPGNRDHIDFATGGLTDGAAEYSTLRYLGLGLGALNNGGTPTGAAAPVPTLTQGPSLTQKVGANAATVAPTATVAGQTYTMDGLSGRLSSPSAGGTVVVQVSSTNATGANTLTVTDSLGNTYVAARQATGCAASRGTSGIYFRSYAAAPGTITLTVRPNTYPASLTWAVMEFANLNMANAASAVDLTAQDASSATGGTSSAVGSPGTTASADQLGLAVSTRCPLADTTATPYSPNAAGATPQRWRQTYGENGDPSVGAQFVNGSAVMQVFPGVVAGPAHVWSFGSAGTAAPAGHVSVLATLKPIGTAAVQTVDAVGVGYNALGRLTEGARNTALGHTALATLTLGSDNTAVGQGAMAAATSALSNTAVGRALATLTIGAGNTAIGNDALAATTTGGYNTAFGYRALAAVNATSEATASLAIGVNALRSQTSAVPMTAFGYNALALANSAVLSNGNTALGASALTSVVTGKQSLAIGASALAANTADDNTAIGYNALLVNTTGAGNTAFGARTLQANTTGGRNTAFGNAALMAGATTSSHTAFGTSALSGGDTTNSGHTAFGASAMASNQASIGNTAFGASALAANTTGKYNVAVGYLALGVGTTPSGATAVGYQALRDASASDNPDIAGADDAGNTAAGYEALMSNAAGYGNTAAGYQALTLATGSRNTALGVRALASTTSGADNTAAGAYALQANTTGSRNTAAGYYALTTNSTGTDNTAAGYHALYSNTTGSRNTGIGLTALYSNTTGNDNTAAGLQALQSNTTGVQNTVEGALALLSTTSGSGNTVRGHSAMRGMPTSSSYNTAYGYDAMRNFASAGPYDYITAYGGEAIWVPRASGTTAAGFRAMQNGCGAESVAIGDQALLSCAAGTGQTAIGFRALLSATPGGTAANTAVGRDALLSNTTGTGNTAVGKDALRANTTGSNNTAIGRDAGPSPTTGCGGVPCQNLVNTLSIGYQAYATVSNTVRLGNAAITSIAGYSALNNPSDRRLKKDIQPVDLGLDFILALKPVSYRLINGNNRLDYGFIAQDVSPLLGRRATNMVLRDKDPQGTWRLSTQHILAPLVRAIQQQQAREDQQAAELKSLRARLDKLRADLRMPTEPEASHAVH